MRYLFRCRYCDGEKTEDHPVGECPDTIVCPTVWGPAQCDGPPEPCPGPMTHRLGAGLQVSKSGRWYAHDERQMYRDIDAYKAMRKQGLQPPRIKGSDRIAAVSESKAEVEWGHKFMTDTGRKLADEVREQAASEPIGGAGMGVLTE